MNDHITHPEIIPLKGRAKDITGQRFNLLVAISPAANVKKEIHWLCRCDCGKETICSGGNLRSGHTKSCGCLKAQAQQYGSVTHGMTHTSIYHTWNKMRQRCQNPNHDRFADYGGRGIRVCDTWSNSFEAFHDYVSRLSHFNESGRSLDRINNDGNYEPGNVRWATRVQQNRNTRQVLQITFDGKTQGVAEWANEYGLDRKRLYKRLWNGWDIKRALMQPVRKSPR